MTLEQQAVAAYEDAGGNIAQAARDLGVARSTLRDRLVRAGVAFKPLAEGRVHGTAVARRRLPRKGQVARYILTSAQNNTYVHAQAWANLLALAEHHDAEVMVGTFTYNQNRYGELAVKRGKAKPRQERLWYDPKVVGLIVDERVELAPGLHWCGEMNILPTAVDPLSGFETYTGRASGIFPQAKFAMRSIAGVKTKPTKFNFTTGCCTLRNYVQKRAGLRAEHHHGYGGLIVEVNHRGDWWVRQLNADSNGDIYDLDLVVEGGDIYESEPVAAITWGDVHELMLSDSQKDAMLDMLDQLNPASQFVHDVMLGSVTNHWEARDPHEKMRRAAMGGGFKSLQIELTRSAEFLNEISSRAPVFVVDSNHDRPWLERWCKNPDGQHDPTNAVLWHELNAAILRSIQESPRDRTRFHLLEHCVRPLLDPHASEQTTFLREDESHSITPAKIECGMHGHLGPNGARGSAQNLTRLGRRANIGHSHSAGIWDGLYVAGTSCDTDLGYNAGPSSWSQSHILTYSNGKRAIVTVWDGAWRA